jgi:hypothetical protein
MINYRKLIRDDIRLYFAPLVGAYKQIKRELARRAIDREKDRLEEINYQKLIHDDLRLYFAPLYGAFMEVKEELERRDRERLTAS